MGAVWIAFVICCCVWIFTAFFQGLREVSYMHAGMFWFIELIAIQDWNYSVQFATISREKPRLTGFLQRLGELQTAVHNCTAMCMYMYMYMHAPYYSIPKKKRKKNQDELYVLDSNSCRAPCKWWAFLAKTSVLKIKIQWKPFKTGFPAETRPNI